MAETIVPLPVDWPGRKLPLMPGDFTHYAPDGMGLGVPIVMRPWDSLDDALRMRSFYGLTERPQDPVRAAPQYDARGGVIYFDNDVEWETLVSALTLMGVHMEEKDFVVFLGSSPNPLEDRYADQARMIQRSTLAMLYNPGPEFNTLTPQTVTIGSYIRQFLAEQQEKWNSRGGAFSPAMYGMFGGDGDWAKEDLCFGFMVENSYLGIYRIWSRAWLVTK